MRDGPQRKRTGRPDLDNDGSRTQYSVPPREIARRCECLPEIKDSSPIKFFDDEVESFYYRDAVDMPGRSTRDRQIQVIGVLPIFGSL